VFQGAAQAPQGRGATEGVARPIGVHQRVGGGVAPILWTGLTPPSASS
jgi:hypothetical protein